VRGSRPTPVVTEIVRNGVIAVTEEMKTNLMCTAYNNIIYEELDFTTALFATAGETISIGIGLPMFIRGRAETVNAKTRHFGRKNIRPGAPRPEIAPLEAGCDCRGAQPAPRRGFLNPLACNAILPNAVWKEFHAAIWGAVRAPQSRL